MNERSERCLKQLQKTKIVSVLRLRDEYNLVPVMEALYRGGVTLIEITATTPGFCKNIKAIREAFFDREDCFVGAGTILTCLDVDAALQAGADFIVSPVFDEAIVSYCVQKQVVVMPGCMTPSEVYKAWKCGATVVKAFPGLVCTPQWFRDLQGPLPFVKMMPTGNVNEETASQYLKAGAIAVGIGKALASEEDICNQDWETIEAHAKRSVSLVM